MRQCLVLGAVLLSIVSSAAAAPMAGSDLGPLLKTLRARAAMMEAPREGSIKQVAVTLDVVEAYCRRRYANGGGGSSDATLNYYTCMLEQGVRDTETITGYCRRRYANGGGGSSNATHNYYACMLEQGVRDRETIAGYCQGRYTGGDAKLNYYTCMLEKGVRDSEAIEGYCSRRYVNDGGGSSDPELNRLSCLMSFK